MRNLIFSTIFAVVVTLSFTQYSEAVCSQSGNTPEGGNIIDCGPPIQNGRLDTDTNPATTEQADEINVLSGGGINTNTGAGINSAGGDDIINIRGDVASTDENAVSSSIGNDTVNMDSGNVLSTTDIGISTSVGNDIVRINGGSISGFFDALNLGSGDDMATINGGSLISIDEDAIDTGAGSDNVTINGGYFEGLRNAVRLSTQDDTLTINGGTFKSIQDPVINSAGGADVVTLNGGFYMGEHMTAIRLAAGDDTLKLGADIDLGGIISCGGGFDTLIFAMGVPINRIPIINEAIASLTAGDGQININGITYVYTNCDQFINEITEPVGLPIPTLSEWGMIAMAGLIGIVGVLFVIRRKTLVS